MAALIGVELGKLISGETRIDIILTPFVTIITGFLTAAFIGPGIQAVMTGLGRLIVWGLTKVHSSWACWLQPLLDLLLAHRFQALRLR